jgi:hypothetical protein
MSLKTNLILLAGAALIGGGVSGCGKLGPLEQPGPLYGERAKEDYAAKRAAHDAQVESTNPTPAADQPDPNADDAPRTTRELKAPDERNVPISKDPIEGIPDPNGPTPSMSPPGTR